MLRAALVHACHLLLLAFFRRIEVVGRHQLPEDGSILFALNHPNGLVDPLFILCLSGKRVSFLAKAPLFHMPFVGIFVRAFECLPVYRSQDGGDPAKNRKMMSAAAQLLAQGNALALFPEGTSHSDPTLKRFRSGAARIALSARALGNRPVHIVPVALYYEKKHAFRSRAVLAFGPALNVPLVALDSSDNSPIEIGQNLTEEIQNGVEDLIPTAENAEGLVLAELAERVFRAALYDSPTACPSVLEVAKETGGLISSAANSPPTLAQRMAIRRRIIDSYRKHQKLSPEMVAQLVDRVERLNSELNAVGLPIDAGLDSKPNARTRFGERLLRAIALAPLALGGLALNAPAYYLVRYFAFRFSADSTDIVATIKILAGMLFFPLSWGVAAGLVTLAFGQHWWLLSFALGPVFAWGALHFLELTASLGRDWNSSSGIYQSGLDWPQISKKRGKLAEDIAQLLV